VMGGVGVVLLFLLAALASAQVAAAGCDSTCTDFHLDGNCLVCGRGWGPHSGHMCREGTRGSWASSANPNRLAAFRVGWWVGGWQC
jgi:hypothetical protein